MSRVTRVLAVDAGAPDRAVVDEAAAVLRRGGLVAFPTETVYGLGANALDEAAVTAIFEAKGRPATDPVIVHLDDIDTASRVVGAVPDAARLLAAQCWPGPLTMILWKRPEVPPAVSAGLETVGIRVPSHPVARALIRSAGVPVAAPSANRFARPSPTSARHVLEDLDGRVDIILDAGPAPIGVESTIVDMTVDPPLVRRPGGIPFRTLAALLPRLQAIDTRGHDDEAQRAPGQMLRHYAPRARLTLYTGHGDAVVDVLAREARRLAAEGHVTGILAPQEDVMALAPVLAAPAAAGRVRMVPYGARRDPARAAHELFASLRTLDAAGVDIIIASCPTDADIGRAIADRLTRAAEGRVIPVGRP